MPGSCGLAGVIAANVGVIDKAGHSREQRCDDSQEHRVKGSAQQIWRIWTGETRQIDEKAQEEEPDRKMNQHGMNRVAQRFAFEEIFQHGSPIPVEDWRRRLQRVSAISFSTFARR